MLKNQPVLYSFLILIGILLFRCAAQQAPSGGKKDTIPPKLIFSFPKNKSVDVKAQFIQLEFDEYIQIEPGIHQQLLITPNIDRWGDKATKKGIKIQFDKPLKPNTTYTFNFRQSIADLNEKNPAQNLKLVFSTGHYIDSLSIYGEVKDILTNKPVQNALVSLYLATDTSIVKKHKPFYFTKTDKQGKYELENLKEGIYKIYAINDINNNLTYQNETEGIGFLEDDLNLNHSIKNLNIGITRIDQTPPIISFKTQNEKYYDIEFNKGLTDIDISSKADIRYKPVDTKIVRIYNLSNNLDSIPINVKATDSSGNILNKDLKIKFAEIKQEEVKKGKTKNIEKKPLFAFEAKVEPGNGGKINPELLVNILFNKPIKTVDINKIQLLGDTLTPIPITDEDWKWNKYKTEWRIQKHIKVNRKVRLLVPKGTFMSIENDSSSNIKNDYELKIAEDYGSISGSIKIKDFKNYIIQLINKENKVLAEQYDVIQYKFDFLEAGDYQLRIVNDKNKNKRWDIGDFNKSIQPEEIIYIDKIINLKQNWDIEENIIL